MLVLGRLDRMRIMSFGPNLMSKVARIAFLSLLVTLPLQVARGADTTKLPKTSQSKASIQKQVETEAQARSKSKTADSDTEIDSANSEKASKSWTTENPDYWNDGFLNSLEWVNHKAGNYTLSTGIIYGKWIAAMKWIKNGKVVLVEYTPPYEYVLAVDPISGNKAKDFVAVDANHDGVLEMAFLHQKLDDDRYHLYTVYALEKSLPKLIWKSGGKLGDWVTKSDPSKPAGAYVKTSAEHRN